LSTAAPAKIKRLRKRTAADSRQRMLRNMREWGVAGVLFSAAALSVLVTAGIVFVLLYESLPFFQKVSLTEFLTATEWTPSFARPRYGILPLVCGTLLTTGVALAVALPIGTVVAIYLSEFAPFAVREVLKPMLELLSAVPTVVYGYFALGFVAPLLQRIIPDLPTFNVLSAGIVMGIMIIPYVSSLSEDAMRSVPMLLREGSYALGGNKIRTALAVVFPSALSGIGAAYILGISRAIGETMIVAIAAGMQPKLTINPTEPAATMTAFIVQVSLGDAEHGGLEYRSIFATGLMLFLMTLTFNILGYILRRRYHQAY
jgi:phosphate transport system permease protein